VGLSTPWELELEAQVGLVLVGGDAYGALGLRVEAGVVLQAQALEALGKLEDGREGDGLRLFHVGGGEVDVGEHLVVLEQAGEQPRVRFRQRLPPRSPENSSKRQHAGKEIVCS